MAWDQEIAGSNPATPTMIQMTYNDYLKKCTEPTIFFNSLKKPYYLGEEVEVVEEIDPIQQLMYKMGYEKR